MTVEELTARLEEIVTKQANAEKAEKEVDQVDQEVDHANTDAALLNIIADARVTAALKAIKAAAQEHVGMLSQGWNPGSDAFRKAIVICIGFDKWIRKHSDLANHDGTMDHVALLVGVYDKYTPDKPKGGDPCDGR